MRTFHIDNTNLTKNGTKNNGLHCFIIRTKFTPNNMSYFQEKEEKTTTVTKVVTTTKVRTETVVKETFTKEKCLSVNYLPHGHAIFAKDENADTGNQENSHSNKKQVNNGATSRKQVNNGATSRKNKKVQLGPSLVVENPAHAHAGK